MGNVSNPRNRVIDEKNAKNALKKYETSLGWIHRPLKHHSSAKRDLASLERQVGDEWVIAHYKEFEVTASYLTSLSPTQISNSQLNSQIKFSSIIAK